MRPTPPGGAHTAMLIPQIGPDGIRETVNARLDPLEAVWNFRSGWNVAALNCQEAKYQPIVDGYRLFLESNAKRLSSINSSLDRQYRNQHRTRRDAIKAREAYMTQVYNYFALPPAHDYFCDEALKISQEALLNPPSDADSFALQGLPRLEGAFERFFSELEQYHVAVAEWDAKWGTLYGAQQTRGVFTNASYGEAHGSVSGSDTQPSGVIPTDQVAPTQPGTVQPVPGEGG